MERTDIEKDTRYLVAGDISYRILKSLGERGVRKLDKKAGEIDSLLKGDDDIGNSVYARVERRDESKARTLEEGIEEFNKQYPDHCSILKGLIEEKRDKKKKFLVYGLKEGYKLGEEDYARVMMDLGFDRREANSIYPHIVAISDRLGKANEKAERTILLKK